MGTYRKSLQTQVLPAEMTVIPSLVLSMGFILTKAVRSLLLLLPQTETAIQIQWNSEPEHTT